MWRPSGAPLFGAAARVLPSSTPPGGTQVPDEVGDSIAPSAAGGQPRTWGAGYATSIRVGKILEEAERKAARFPRLRAARGDLRAQT